MLSKGSSLLTGKIGVNGADAVTVIYCTRPVTQVLVQATVAPPVADPAAGHWQTMGPTTTAAPVTPDNVPSAAVRAPVRLVGMRVAYCAAVRAALSTRIDSA